MTFAFVFMAAFAVAQNNDSDVDIVGNDNEADVMQSEILIHRLLTLFLTEILLALD